MCDKTRTHSIGFLLGLALLNVPVRAQQTHPALDSGAVPGATKDPRRVVHVEKSARLLSTDPSPIYPELLRRVGIEGEIRVRFTVDTLGRAEVASFTVVTVLVDLDRMRQTTPQSGREPDSVDEMAAKVAFTESVRRALPGMQFAPAEMDGHRVRELVELPFNFHLDH